MLSSHAYDEYQAKLDNARTEIMEEAAISVVSHSVNVSRTAAPMETPEIVDTTVTENPNPTQLSDTAEGTTTETAEAPETTTESEKEIRVQNTE